MNVLKKINRKKIEWWSEDLLENHYEQKIYRYRYLAGQGWSLHRSGGGFGFPTLRQRLSLTGVWLLSRMHSRIVERMPVNKDIANSSNDVSQVFLFDSRLIKISFSWQKIDISLVEKLLI